MKLSIQQTLGQAKDRSEGIGSEVSRMKECVQETKDALSEAKQTVTDAAEVLYTQKLRKRLLGRSKTKLAKAGSRQFRERLEVHLG